MSRLVLNAILSLIGAALGGVFGWFAFEWMYEQGFYAGILPGALVGLGGGLLSRDRSLIRGAIFGLAGLALGLFLEWRFFPFNADKSLGYFLTNIHRVIPVHLLMIALGTFFAFWWGRDTIPGILKRGAIGQAKPSPESEPR
jgi:hypothetical protein